MATRPPLSVLAPPTEVTLKAPLIPALNRLATIGLCLLLCSLPYFGWGCASPAQVTFQLKGKTPSVDGSFSNQYGWTISPTTVRVVIGDIHLKATPPDENLQVFSSLAPLVKLGEEVKSEDIGKDGKFPGLWAINILQNAEPLTFPTGQVAAEGWQQIQLRMSPAVSGIRGLTANDPLAQQTLVIIGQIRKDTSACNIRLKVSTELGLGIKIDFATKSTLIHRNTIEISYDKWLQDVQFDKFCSPTTQNTVELDATTAPSVTQTVINSIPQSISFQFSQGSAT